MQSVAELFSFAAGFFFAQFASVATTRAKTVNGDAKRRQRGRFSYDQVCGEFAAVVPILPSRNRIEHGVAVTQAHCLDRHWIPDYVAEPANRRERFADLVPVISGCHICWHTRARQAG